MWKPRAAALLCCLGVLPLIGCVGAPTIAWRGQPVIPAGAIGSPPPVYAVGPSAPAAILVMLPGAGAVRRQSRALGERRLRRGDAVG